MCSVCIMASTEGIVKCFGVKAPFDYQGTPCSVLADKGTELRWGSLFHSEKPRELKEHVFCFALGFFPLTCFPHLLYHLLSVCVIGF